MELVLNNEQMNTYKRLNNALHSDTSSSKQLTKYLQTKVQSVAENNCLLIVELRGPNLDMTMTLCTSNPPWSSLFRKIYIENEQMKILKDYPVSSYIPKHISWLIVWDKLPLGVHGAL